MTCNSLTLEKKLNMIGMLNWPRKPVQHNQISRGNYARISTTNKNTCAPDPRLGVGAFPYLDAGLPSERVRFFIWRKPMSKNNSTTVQTVPEIFNYSNHQVRTLTHDNGAIWFVARDIFKSLTIPWAGKRTLDILDPSWSMVVKLTTTHKNQHGAESKIVKDIIFINEPAVYKLAFRSNKPEADKFTNWVASEVLPSIRKTGAYAIPVQQLLPETLTPSEQHQLTTVVKFKAERNGKAIAEIWGRVKNKFKVAKYDQIPRDDFQAALEYVASMEVKSLAQVVSEATEPKAEEARQQEPLSQEERNAIMDDIYNQIGHIRMSVDNLLCFYRDTNRSLNKIGNLISILNDVDYKDRRRREMQAGR